MGGHTDWDEYRLVLAIARAGSLAGAGRALRLNHATVLRRLAILEERLGVRLFERGREGAQPTPAGMELAKAAGCMEETALDAERKLEGRDLTRSCTIRVTTTDTLGLTLLRGLFRRFARDHPDIAIELVLSVAHLNLTRREADVAIRPSAQPPETLIGRRIATIASAFYARRNAPFLNGRTDFEPESLPLVLPDESLDHLASVRWARERHLTARLRADSLLALRVAVEAGIGVAPLPCFVGDSSQKLVRLGPPVPAFASELWVLTHRDLKSVPRIQVFTEAAARFLVARRAAFEGTILRQDEHHAGQ